MNRFETMSTTSSAIAMIACVAVLGVAGSAAAQRQTLAAPSASSLEDGAEVSLPPELEELRIDPKLGGQTPLDARFVDENGHQVRFGDFFATGRPVLLAPVYYECPMLCSMVLDGVVRSLRPLQLTPGEDFEVVAVSINHRETPAEASATREKALAQYRREGTDAGWHFLVGSEEDVAALMESVGFPYRYDPETGLYAHTGAVMLLTADGRVSRYFYGVDYPSRDVRLGLVEASENRIGTLVDQVLLFCYQYDPVLGKYSAVTWNIIRLAGGLTVLVLAIAVGLMLYRERAANRTAKATA